MEKYINVLTLFRIKGKNIKRAYYILKLLYLLSSNYDLRNTKILTDLCFIAKYNYNTYTYYI